ncbi:MAG TPA: putative quinol monooxygenase [Ktedonobacteraceae bacterium]|nr:putative quinol monooxygenase [Ktedonobacteraceae bacterium]
MSAYGCYVKFSARPGQRDALVEQFLSVADLIDEAAGCELYIINTSPTEPESVWVTEMWRSQEEHDASLTLESAQAAIKRVMPLLAVNPEKIDILPVGGKGFTLV